eukprot:scaffold117873_cov30-Tisochrysis_lutea.AAC.1
MGRERRAGGATGTEHTGRHRRTMSRHDEGGQNKRQETEGRHGRERPSDVAGRKERSRTKTQHGAAQGNTLGNHRRTGGKLIERGRGRALEERGKTANTETLRPSLAKETGERREGMRERKEGIPAVSCVRGNLGREERGGTGCGGDTVAWGSGAVAARSIGQTIANQ